LDDEAAPVAVNLGLVLAVNRKGNRVIELDLGATLSADRQALNEIKMTAAALRLGSQPCFVTLHRRTIPETVYVKAHRLFCVAIKPETRPYLLFITRLPLLL
jgi:hypothetical protein